MGEGSKKGHRVGRPLGSLRVLNLETVYKSRKVRLRKKKVSWEKIGERGGDPKKAM